MDGRAAHIWPEGYTSRFNWYIFDLRFRIFHDVLTTCQRYSAHGRLLVRNHNLTHIQHTPRLELWLHLRQQRHVWRPVRNLARALSREGPWNRQCVSRLSEPYLRYHGA